MHHARPQHWHSHVIWENHDSIRRPLITYWNCTSISRSASYTWGGHRPSSGPKSGVSSFFTKLLASWRLIAGKSSIFMDEFPGFEYQRLWEFYPHLTCWMFALFGLFAWLCCAIRHDPPLERWEISCCPDSSEISHGKFHGFPSEETSQWIIAGSWFLPRRSMLVNYIPKNRPINPIVL